MKKPLFLFVVLTAIAVDLYAQGMTATLESGDKLNAYYGIDAFKEAYEAAQDGDRIALSAGTYNVPSDNITKSISITGVGAYEESANTAFKSLTVSGTDIRIEGVKFTDALNVSGSRNLIVTRCWVERLASSNNYYNILFDQTVIKDVDALDRAESFTFKNSTIYKFSRMNDKSKMGYITNCVIYWWYYYGYGYNQPYAIYRNNLIGHNPYNENTSYAKASAPSEFYNNVTFSINSTYPSLAVVFEANCINEDNQVGLYSELFGGEESYPAYPKNAPNGDDGTPVGPLGGTGFSPYPAVPRIVSRTIDGSTDDEGKINVRIEVKAEK